MRHSSFNNIIHWERRNMIPCLRNENLCHILRARVRKASASMFRLVLFSMMVACAHADVTTTWNGSAGNWTDSARWSGSVFPDNSGPNLYHAVINAGTVTLSQSVSINQFTLGGGTLTGSGSITLTAGLVNSITGVATIGGGTIFGGAGATIAVQPGASLTVLDGANFFAQVSSPACTLANAGTLIARNISGPGFTTVDATFSNTGTLRVENTAISHTLSLAGGGSLGGSVHLDAATTLELGGAFNIPAGTTFTGSGTLVVAGTTTLGGNLTTPHLSVPAGTLRLAGQGLVVGGNASIGDFGTIAVQIRGTGALADKLTCGGTLSAYGTLTVSLGSGFVPAVGDTFDILDFASFTGSFATVQFPALPAGRFWRTNALHTEGRLIVSSIPANYAAWQSYTGAGAFTEDDDSDGIANGFEYALGLPSEMGGVSPVTASIAANRLRIHFQIPDPCAADVVLRIEASDDLGKTDPWTPIATKAGVAAWTGPATVSLGPAAGGHVGVTVQDTHLVTDTPKRFLRLQVQMP
jgi:hypothetical protein